MAGTVGAIFNGALQLGSAIGIAAVSSIETSVEQTHGGPTSYAGRRASFWFLLAIVAAEFGATLVFFRVREEDTDRPKVRRSASASAVDEKTGQELEEPVSPVDEKARYDRELMEEPVSPADSCAKDAFDIV